MKVLVNNKKLVKKYHKFDCVLKRYHKFGMTILFLIKDKIDTIIWQRHDFLHNHVMQNPLWFAFQSLVDCFLASATYQLGS